MAELDTSKIQWSSKRLSVAQVLPGVCTIGRQRQYFLQAQSLEGDQDLKRRAAFLQVGGHGRRRRRRRRRGRAGIHLLELEPARVEQKELPLDESLHGRDELMSAMDRINAKYEHGSLYLASAGTAGARREWTLRQGLTTPEYTTRLADLPVAVL